MRCFAIRGSEFHNELTGKILIGFQSLCFENCCMNRVDEPKHTISSFVGKDGLVGKERARRNLILLSSRAIIVLQLVERLLHCSDASRNLSELMAVERVVQQADALEGIDVDCVRENASRDHQFGTGQLQQDDGDPPPLRQRAIREPSTF